MAKTETTVKPEQQRQRGANRQQAKHSHHHEHLIDRKQELREENIILVQRNQLLAQIRNSMARLVMARNRGRTALPGEETEEERLARRLQGEHTQEEQAKTAGTELQNDERIKLVGRQQQTEDPKQAHDPAHQHEQELTPDKVNVVAKREIGTAQEQADRTQVQTVGMADEAAIQQDLGAPGLDVVSTEVNPVVLQMHIYRSRNRGAKEFDDFARGIQTWLSTLEMEAIRRFHSLHLDPIEEAFEEYVLRMAQGLVDLISKALLLSRLKVCQKAAIEVARLALEMIKKLLENREEDIPLEKMFTWKRIQELQKAELNADSGF